VTKALECALEKHSDYSTEARKIIVELNIKKWNHCKKTNADGSRLIPKSIQKH